MHSRILSFSGRKHSGKTHLANICRQYDYKVVNFADSLKQLVSDCLNITREFLDNNKETQFQCPIRLDEKYVFISSTTNIPLEHVIIVLNKSFTNIRHILQVIGTDLIRQYNPLWHINHLEQLLVNNPDDKFCVADTRFPNEKDMLQKLGAECWFILRPDCIDISNHISETSLEWHHFGFNVIVNTSLDIFNKKWINYLTVSSKHLMLRKQINNMLHNNINKHVILKCLELNDYSFTWLCNHLMICRELFKYKHKMIFSCNLPETTSQHFSKKDFEHLKSIKNPFIIENAKKHIL